MSHRTTGCPEEEIWVPKTIDQIHKEAEMEEHREQIKVQQQLLSRKDSSQGRGGRGGPHSSGGRGSQTQDEGWT